MVMANSTASNFFIKFNLPFCIVFAHRGKRHVGGVSPSQYATVIIRYLAQQINQNMLQSSRVSGEKFPQFPRFLENFYFSAIRTAVSRAIRIMAVKVVWRSSALSSSPVTMLSEMEQRARARLPR